MIGLEEVVAGQQPQIQQVRSGSTGVGIYRVSTHLCRLESKEVWSFN